jgi:Protein of unknown function (DUF2973)
MWLHVLYILAFSIIAVLAIGNLIRSMVALGMESQGQEPPNWATPYGPSRDELASRKRSPQHPEMLDSDGQVINEPLLVMRSLSMDDARERLDAIYRSSPGGESETSEN